MREDDSPAQAGCGTIHDVGATMGVNRDFAVVLPVLRTDVPGPERRRVSAP